MASRVEIGEPRGDIAAIVGEHQTLAEWVEELGNLASAEDAEVILDARRAGEKLSLPDAFHAIRAAFSDSPREVVVFVATARLAEVARSILNENPKAGPGRFFFGPVTVQLEDANLVSTRADVIVKASNTRLKLGSGVSGALRVACGPALQGALDRIGPISSESFAETPAFALTTASKILHVPTAAGTAETVGRAYQHVVRRCCEAGYRSVAVPALGCGAGGLSLSSSAELLLEAVRTVRPTAEPLLVIVALLNGRGRAEFERVFSGVDARETEQGT